MEPLRIRLFQHVPFEGPGTIAQWASLRGHHLGKTCFFAGEPLPDVGDQDWLVVMGGPMGVYEEDRFEWLAAEKQFISRAIGAGKTVLGICLGAQLIASALGARVYPQTEKEIGWFPLSLTAAGGSDPFLSVLEGDPVVFHWHGDTFDLPEGAVSLARTEVCRQQAFRYGERVLGLQFHLEMEEKALEGMLLHGVDELAGTSRYVQSPAEIRDGHIYLKDNRESLFRVLDAMAKARR